MNNTEMKHYESSEWHFALDVPRRCREYFVAEDTLAYTLGFGTTNKACMFELYDRMAKSFEILAESPSPSTDPST